MRHVARRSEVPHRGTANPEEFWGFHSLALIAGLKLRKLPVYNSPEICYNVRLKNDNRNLPTEGCPVNIPEDTYRKLEELITSADSPVGIDAKKTHILILHKLTEIERKLDSLTAEQE
ncbi:MAG: hypothetical protein IH914_03560 [candidate division Zixibacteria bacterium]|nr:hypothetical protein [candidate division Zixibacteria bacterium]